MNSKIQYVDISTIKPNKKNPRTITEGQLNRLAKSIEDFPRMLELRPVIVDKKNVIIGGNMRYAAANQVGLKKIPILRADDLTPDQVKEFIIKDNVGFGEWDTEELKSWDVAELQEWGLDIPSFDSESVDPNYSKKITAPIYEPSNKKPAFAELFNETKVQELIAEINRAEISEDEKSFLVAAAHRHRVFNYEKVADFYAHSNPVIQELMEKSALVIIDFDKAIENGFVRMSEQLRQFSAEDKQTADA